jgi:radical SAM superfamily enzyme YgiQ (UPF0313 family)
LRKVKVLLVNANPYIEYVVIPYGLEILKANLPKDIAHVKIVHPYLASTRPELWIKKEVSSFNPDIVGLSIRNIDDLIIVGDIAASKGYNRIDLQFYLEKIKRLVMAIKDSFRGKLLLLGGSGFTACPEECMSYLDVDLGVMGPGELVLKRIVCCLRSLRIHDIYTLEGIIFRSRDTFVKRAPLMRLGEGRFYRDEAFKYRSGVEGYIPVRTKVGCSLRCWYCIEYLNLPGVSFRKPSYVLREIRSISSGTRVCKISFTDSEFNLPSEVHPSSICSGLILSGLSRKVEWLAFFNIKPFSKKFARLIRNSGATTVSLTVDHCNDGILRRIGKNFSKKDIEETIRTLSQAGLKKIWSFIFGMPGEDHRTIREAIDFVKRHLKEGDTFQYQCGVRVYPGTPLAEYVKSRAYRNLYPSRRDPDFLLPVVYSQPLPPWELNEILREEFKGFPNVGLFNTSKEIVNLVDERFLRLRRYSSMGAYYYSIGDLKSAISLYERAIGAGCKLPRVLFDTLQELSRIYLQARDHQRLVGCYKKMLRIQKEISPVDRNFLADIYNNLASSLTELGRYSEALSSLKHSLKLNPNHGLAKKNLEKLQRFLK